MVSKSENWFAFAFVAFGFYEIGRRFADIDYLVGLLMASIPFFAVGIYFHRGAVKAEEELARRQSWVSTEEKIQNLYNKLNPLHRDLGLPELELPRKVESNPTRSNQEATDGSRAEDLWQSVKSQGFPPEPVHPPNKFLERVLGIQKKDDNEQND